MNIEELRAALVEVQRERDEAVQAKQAPLLSQGFTTAYGGTVHGGLAPIQQSHGAKVTAE